MSENGNTDNRLEQYSELEDLLAQAGKLGIKALPGRDLVRLGQLYRRAAAELSIARTQGIDGKRIEYLNSIVGRSYEYVYHVIRKPYPSLKNFYLNEFPQVFRKNLQFIGSAFLLFILAALFSGMMVVRDPGKADIILGPTATAAIENVAQRHVGTKDWMPKETRPLVSAQIIGNNVRVSIMAFAMGIFACLPTLIVLFYNGLFLGVIGGAVVAKGPHIALGFYSFVAPHGVIELTAIFIAAGAGLLLGWNLLCPGIYSRKNALRLAGRDAFVLVVGVTSMLLIAGLIEAFFSPTMLPNPFKLSVALVLGVMLYTYLFTCGREVVVDKQG
jgi:uncharacterized membrane protein SpoIIM required for sporulation